jgi:hypothetical protein
LIVSIVQLALTVHISLSSEILLVYKPELQGDAYCHEIITSKGESIVGRTVVLL